MSEATGAFDRPSGRLEVLAWAAAALVLVTLAVPWFLWRDATVVAGLPLWIWWHVGWMAVASVVFYVFTQRAWGVGVLPDSVEQGTADDGNQAADAGEVNRRG